MCRLSVGLLLVVATSAEYHWTGTEWKWQDETDTCESFKWNETLKVNKDLKFTNKFNFGEDSVEATLWVKLTAFTCMYKPKDLKRWDISIENTEEKGKEKSCLAPKKDGVITTETTVPPEARGDNKSDQLVFDISSKEPTIIEEDLQETNNCKNGDTSSQEDDDDYDNDLEGSGGIICESEDTNAWHNIGTTLLKKWKQYNLKITVANNDGNTTTEVAHDTMEWSCKDGVTKIPRMKICDHSEDCPGGEDEGEVCNPSALPRKLSFICYAFMATVIIIYIFCKTCCKIPRNYNTELKTGKRSIDEKKDFVSRYKEAHNNTKEFLEFLSEVKFALYKAGSPEKTAQVCLWARMAEQELHPKPKQRYRCFLLQVTGDFFFFVLFFVTLILEPIMIPYRVMQNIFLLGSDQLTGDLVAAKVGLKARLLMKINRWLAPRVPQWYIGSLFVMFLKLCLHMFDYVKDVGEFLLTHIFNSLFITFSDITSVIFHFDTEVLQQTYDQHQGFNFFYFFLSSVILLAVSHIFNAIYWTLLKHTKSSVVNIGG